MASQVLDAVEKQRRGPKGKESEHWNAVPAVYRAAFLAKTPPTKAVQEHFHVGIPWTNVDLEHKHLVVADTVVIVDNRPLLRLGVTKSKASARTIELDERTVSMLREHRQRQSGERMAAGPAWQDNDLTFCREDGTVISPERLTRRAKTLVEEVGFALGIVEILRVLAKLVRA